jgi:hypothetical protein
MPIISNLNIYLSDIIMAAVLAFLATVTIRMILRMSRIMRSIKGLMDNSVNNDEIIKRCYSIYSMDTFNFHGQTLKRGMHIRLTTLQDKSYEGEIIGLNSNNMLCIITRELVIAHELSNVREIMIIKKS